DRITIEKPGGICRLLSADEELDFGVSSYNYFKNSFVRWAKVWFASVFPVGPAHFKLACILCEVHFGISSRLLCLHFEFPRKSHLSICSTSCYCGGQFAASSLGPCSVPYEDWSSN